MVVFGSLASLAERCGLSRAAVKRSLGKLLVLDLIALIHRGSSFGKASEYDLAPGLRRLAHMEIEAKFLTKDGLVTYVKPTFLRAARRPIVPSDNEVRLLNAISNGNISAHLERRIGRLIDVVWCENGEVKTILLDRLFEIAMDNTTKVNPPALEAWRRRALADLELNEQEAA